MPGERTELSPEMEERSLRVDIEEVAREIDELADDWQQGREAGNDVGALEVDARRINVLRTQLEAKKTILESLEKK